MEAIQKVEQTEVKMPEPGTSKRHFTVEYKMKIVQEAQQCERQVGGISALLRREGLYFSQLSQWRNQMKMGLSAVRGPKVKKTPEGVELEKLRKENTGLKEELRQARLVLEAQKKIQDLLQKM